MLNDISQGVSISGEEKQNKSVFRRFWWIFLVIVIILIAVVLIFRPKKDGQQNSIINQVQQTVQNKDNLEPRIKSIGFNLDYYNPSTNKAGDLVFAKFNPPYDRIFVNYGHKMLAQYSAERRESLNVHPSFILPAETKLFSPIDGIVSSVTVLYSGDSSIQISADGKLGSLTFGLEHVKNPIVKAGDKVTAGHPIAEVTDVTSDYHPGYGYFDLTVFSANKAGQPQHHCPFLYLDDSVKDDIFAKIRAFYKSWEEFTGDSSAYDESAYPVPGCVITDPIDG